jgi:uroporphyrinogen-III synthase
MGPTRPRIVIVRAERRAGALAARLEAAGFDVAVCPLVDIEPLGEGSVDVTGYDWLVVTSPNAAEELVRRGVRGAIARVAAIGPGTRDVLAAGGIAADVVPKTSTQEGLLAALPQPAGRVVVAAAEGARRTLSDELGADFLALYRTVELEVTEPPDGDFVALASSSQARAFARLGQSIPVVSIGPQTTATARECGLDVVVEAESHDLNGLVAAIKRAADAR